MLSDQTFSLDHVRIVSVPGGAITLAHGDGEAIDANGVQRRATARDDVRRRATTRKVRRLLRHEVTSR